MAETGQPAAWVGREKGFEIREYPVPGAALLGVPRKGRVSCRTPRMIMWASSV